MNLRIDTTSKRIYLLQEHGEKEIKLYSKEAFDLISQLWLKIGWNEKYSYTFSWMGRPIIQLPEDMIRTQEVIYRVKPDVIIETGVAHGGSLIYYASLCKAMGRGRVIGVDIVIRPENRKAIETHELSPWISLIEGDSVSAEVLHQVQSMVKPNEQVLVLLDSNHTREHVRAELEAYHSLVTRGSYIVATDGIMRDLYDVPRGQPGWDIDNPATAAAEFVEAHPEFVMEQPDWVFNESNLNQNLTHWPDAWLRRRG
jgi:cephalosporin hydroxylase